MEENKLGCIGAGIGSGIDNTIELKVLSFEEAMASMDKTKTGKPWLIMSMNGCSKMMFGKLLIKITFLLVLTSLTQLGQ